VAAQHQHPAASPRERAIERGNHWVGGKFGGEESRFGIDVSGLRSLLRLTPEERLTRKLDAVRFAAQGRAVGPDLFPPVPVVDPRCALCALASAGVHFVLIGGWAGTLHGSNYATDTLELLVEPSPANHERLVEALRTFAIQPGTEDSSASASLGGQGTGGAETSAPFAGRDSLPNGAGYSEVHGRATTMDVGLCQVAVASLEDLIDIQRRSQEPSDRILLEDLRELRVLTSKSSPPGRSTSSTRATDAWTACGPPPAPGATSPFIGGQNLASWPSALCSSPACVTLSR
jgi:hypothetical protein